MDLDEARCPVLAGERIGTVTDAIVEALEERVLCCGGRHDQPEGRKACGFHLHRVGTVGSGFLDSGLFGLSNPSHTLYSKLQ